MFSSQSGIYTGQNCKNSFDHAVLVTGSADGGNGTVLLTIKNSWGTGKALPCNRGIVMLSFSHVFLLLAGWGQNGFFKMPACACSTCVYTAWPQGITDCKSLVLHGLNLNHHANRLKHIQFRGINNQILSFWFPSSRLFLLPLFCAVSLSVRPNDNCKANPSVCPGKQKCVGSVFYSYTCNQVRSHLRDGGRWLLLFGCFVYMHTRH